MLGSADVSLGRSARARDLLGAALSPRPCLVDARAFAAANGRHGLVELLPLDLSSMARLQARNVRNAWHLQPG